MTPFFPLKYFSDGPAAAYFKGKLYSGFNLGEGKKKVTVTYCGIGDKLLGDAVLLLGGAAVKKIMFIGTCGGFKTSDIGDIVVAKSAFNGEGFSRYLEQGFSMQKFIEGKNPTIPVDTMNDEVMKYLSERVGKEKIKEGKIFTIGSLMAETYENLRDIEENGFIGIEMELSAVYAAANQIKAAATGLLLVSDKPLEKGLEEIPDPEELLRFRQGFTDLPRLAAEFMTEKILF